MNITIIKLTKLIKLMISPIAEVFDSILAFVEGQNIRHTNQNGFR